MGELGLKRVRERVVASGKSLTFDIRPDEELLTAMNKWEKTPRSRLKIAYENLGRLPTVMSCKVAHGGSADLRSVFWAGSVVCGCATLQRPVQYGGHQSTLIVGPVVTIIAKTNEISMDVSDAKLAQRRKSWKAPKSLVDRGVLGKYQRLVGSASEGAMTDLF